MHRRTTRLNHVLLSVTGLVLLAAGGYLVGRDRGWVQGDRRHARLYSRAESRWLAAHDWIWVVVAAAAVVVGLLALRWLLVQPRVDRVRALRVDPDPAQRGRTALAADVLTAAVEDDVADLPDVARARALVIGERADPELVVRVQAVPGRDLAGVVDGVLGRVVPDARTALDAADLPVQVHLLVGGRDRTPARAAPQ